MKQIAFTVSTLLLLLFGCKKDTTREIDSSYHPDINPVNFSNSTTISNPYFPALPGKKYIYEGQTDEGLERVEEQRLVETKTIMGITCIVVNDKEYANGKLIEDTRDWYAQDNDGNLWYFGETVDNYNANGTLLDHGGSWEAGIDGAQPGIIMPANPQTGLRYREEYYFGHAEDEAEITNTGITETILLGTFNNCVKTKNWTVLEPDDLENKIYAPGVGLIKEINIPDKFEVTLISIL
ncbi:MAG TPA: hypothetical protein VFG46_21445 [Chryseolinea sp.]|jgi:hypothetical protein|nr:hypothetical protein [Chryseolinea sp.]